MVTAVLVGIMLMALLAALSPSSLRAPLAAIVTIIVVIGSASIYTPGIGTGGWLLATIPLSPFIFAASYLVVWTIQLLGDGLGPTKISAGILTLTAVMASPVQIALLLLIGSPLVYFGFSHGIQYILRRLAEAE